jgi:hypothetical protein
VRTAAILALAAVPLAAQLTVYSEFQRVDPFGNVVPVDRAEHPREILSPAVPRNAWTSFHVAVQAPGGRPVFLYTQQNPDQLKVTLYKERFVKTASGWIPDALERVANNPAMGLLPERDNPIPGQNTIVYWLDIWVPPNVPTGRMRFEVVLKSSDRWTMHPMELRIMHATVPPSFGKPGPAPPPAARADTALLDLLRTRLCRAPASGRPAPLTVRDLLRRNALQDLALSSNLNHAFTHAGIDPASICKQTPPPEWWLKVRYALLQSASTR